MSININNNKGTLRQRVITPALVAVLATLIRLVVSGECGGVGDNAVVSEFFESAP